MADTNKATETLASTVFLEKNTIQSIAINTYDLLSSNQKQVLDESWKNHNPLNDADRIRYTDLVLPETYRYMDLHILVLKNKTVVVGYSSPKDISEYSRELGQYYALQDAINKAEALLAIQFKDDIVSTQFVNDLPVIEECFSASFSLFTSEKPFSIYSVNLADILDYIYRDTDIEHHVTDTSLAIGMVKSNSYMFFDYHQTSKHVKYNEVNNRSFVITKAIINFSACLTMLDRTQQQA